MNSELPIEITDSLCIGMKGLDVCDNTIFHSAVMAGNADFIDAMYSYILPYNIFGTPQYTLGFHYFTDQILMSKNYNKQSVYDLLQQLRNKPNFEKLSNVVTSLANLLFNLNYIREVRSYFSIDKPNKDMSVAVYTEIMAKINSDSETTMNEMNQILGNHIAKINGDQYFLYSVRIGHRNTVECLINLNTRIKNIVISNNDICGLYWNNIADRDKRNRAFLRWDAVVQQAARCT